MAANKHLTPIAAAFNSMVILAPTVIRSSGVWNKREYIKNSRYCEINAKFLFRKMPFRIKIAEKSLGMRDFDSIPFRARIYTHTLQLHCFGVLFWFFFRSSMHWECIRNVEPSFFFPHCKNENKIATHARSTYTRNVFSFALVFHAVYTFFLLFISIILSLARSFACRVRTYIRSYMHVSVESTSHDRIRYCRSCCVSTSSRELSIFSIAVRESHSKAERASERKREGEHAIWRIRKRRQPPSIFLSSSQYIYIYIHIIFVLIPSV